MRARLSIFFVRNRVDVFLNMHSYDDAVTYQLVGAASEILDTSASNILIAFGKFWVNYTVEAGYGEMLKMAGDNFPEFLMNLDRMHAGIGHTYSRLQPPSFECQEIDGSTVVVQYRSKREGLGPLVIGLLHGLGDRFNLQLEIHHNKTKEAFGYDEFMINYFPLSQKSQSIEQSEQSI